MTDIPETPPRDAQPLWLAQVAMSPQPEAMIRQHCAALVASATPDTGVAPYDGTRPLEVLLVGYNGAGNLGADVRVAELVRQIAHLMAPLPVTLRLVTVAPHLPPSLFPTRIGNCEIVEEEIADYVPLAMDRLVQAADVVLACEGSMFKSTFSDTLSTIMFAAVAMARAYGKLAVAVGAEAGTMAPDLERFAIASFGDTPILARNDRSRDQLLALGLNAQTGADTAWSFRAAGDTVAKQVLTGMGCAPDQPVTIVCPINPFWWPVHIDLARFAGLTEPDPLHYGAGFFHADSEERRAKTAAYLDQLAAAIDAHRAATGSFILVLGMERVDAQAVAALADRLSPDTATVVSGDHNPETMVAILRQADLLVSSRFHAVVLALGGGVPAVGVSLDERIATLLADAGAPDRVLPVDPEILHDQLTRLLAKTWAERADLGAPSRAQAARELAAQGRQGIILRTMIAGAFPAVADRLAPLNDGLPSDSAIDVVSEGVSA